MDLIKRQDAIDALWKALYDYEDKTEKQFLESEELNVDDWFSHRIFVQNMSDIDRQTILNVPSAQQWIPVSERLPDKDGDYLAFARWGDGEEYEIQIIPFDSCLNGFGFVEKYLDRETLESLGTEALAAFQSSIGADVIAWMPLPQPWKESEKT